MLGSPYISCKVKVNQYFRHVHNCLEVIILIPMSTNNPSLKSVVLEYPAKPSLGCHFSSPDLVWQKIQEPLIQDNYALLSLREFDLYHLIYLNMIHSAKLHTF